MQYIQNANKGLYTNHNEFGQDLPQGAMTIAENVVIDKTDIVSPRRGYQKLYPIGAAERFANLFSFDEKILCHKDTNKLAYYDSGWTEYTGTYSVADSNLGRMKHAKASSNIYFATSDGIKKLDAYNASVVSAGIPRALDGQGALTAVAAGFLSDSEQVAYRVVWGRRDSNNNLVLGAPSQIINVSNTTGSAEDVVLTITIPSGITVNDFYQVYRSANYATTTTPNDELLLVEENNPDATAISNGYLSFTDSTPADLRGATLYTSPSQEGIEKANYQPPLAKDIAYFNNHMFFANTQGKQNRTITYLGGLSNDDTITINGIVYTGKAAEDASNAEFQIYTTGSASQNIADTAKSLCKVINRYSTNTEIYAYYISNVDDLPGKIFIEARALSLSQFSITSSNGDQFNPVLPSSGTSVSSVSDTFQHYLFYSKYDEPEAVPLLQFFPVGEASSEILRIVPLKESLLIFKEDGVYRLTGDDEANFYIDQLDPTTKLLSPDSAVALNNQVYGLFDQGVCSVSDTGVSIRSRAIEDQILELFSVSLSGIKQYSFGIGYDSDRKFILYTIKSSGDTYATQAFVYNFITNAWTTWDLSARCGFVYPEEDKIYMGRSTDNYMFVERKTYTFRDFVDESYDKTISAVSGTTLTLNSLANVEVGDLIYVTSSKFSVIASKDNDNFTVTLNDDLSWTTGACELLKAIDCDIEYSPLPCGNPAMLKQTRELHVFFKEKFFYSAQVGLTANTRATTSYIDVSGSASNLLWGLFAWGGVPWGGFLTPGYIRTYIPRAQQRNTWLKVRIKIFSAYCQFAIDGISLVYRECSTKAYQ